MSGAIGLEQLKKLPGYDGQRRKNWRCSRGCSGRQPFHHPARERQELGFCFTIVLNPDLQADREKMLPPSRRRHPVPHHHRGQFPAPRRASLFRLPVHGGAAPNADIAHDNGFFVGNHPFDLSSQIEKLYRVLDKSC